MTKEDENLVLLDLCGRLPFGVKAKVITLYNYYDLLDSSKDRVIEQTEEVEFTFDNFSEIVRKSNIALYLRPMSSMTEEEINEFHKLRFRHINYGSEPLQCVLSIDEIEWLNQHHFDYRDLIGKGLALVAPENMYN